MQPSVRPYRAGVPVQPRAFTLVELLVVIGIIAVLMSILMPALNRAREQARSVQCLSNLRQISMATLAYINENKGMYPGRAGQGAESWFDGNPKKFWGWVCWYRKVDPVIGNLNADSNAHDLNITYSALAPYLNFKLIDHNPTNSTALSAYAAAHNVSPDLESIYRCPSDKLEQRIAFTSDNNGGRGIYRYSYSMNICFSDKKPNDAGTAVVSRKFYLKYNMVRRASEKILYIDESEKSVNNGEYNPTTPLSKADDPSKDYTAIAERHESKARRNSDDARGNVAFADGHAEFFSRTDAFKREYYDPEKN